jgi:ERCC4-type nuclease
VSIALDFRTGSKELAPFFLPYGIQPKLQKLDYGDIAFEGNGPRGRCAIVIERKQINDLVQSIESRRLSGHQLPGMAEDYDYCYLIVEGLWKPGPSGELMIGQGNIDGDASFGGRWVSTYGKLRHRAVDNYLATLEMQAGVIYRRTLSIIETVAVVVDLYRWWTEKTWEQHSSHLAVYAPAIARPGRTRLNLARRNVSLAEKWAMQLDGVDTKAQLVAEYFGSAIKLAVGNEVEWAEIKGIGKPSAKRIVREINAAL